MKKSSVVFSVFVAMITLVLSSTVFIGKAQAFATFGYRNGYGITGQKYWVETSGSASLTDWQKQYFDDAMYQWNTSSQSSIVTPMSITRTTDRTASIIDVFFLRDRQPSKKYVHSVGHTEWYNWGTSVVNPTTEKPTSNWSSATILLGGIYWNPVPSEYYNGLSNNNKRYVFAHEIGHSIGLAHWTPGTIMTNESANTVNFYKPTADDLNGVNYLY